MREREHRLRERGLRLDSRAAKAADFFRRHRAALLIVAAGALLLAHVGAFDTGQTPRSIRFPYFMFLNLTGGLMSAMILDRLASRSWLQQNVLALGAAIVVIVTLLLTPVVWVTAAITLNGSWRVERIAVLLPQVLPIAAAFVTLQLLLDRPASDVVAPPSAMPSESSRLLKLVPELRGAELHAIEAEDHYLRFHTDRGSTLVLMRLTDAVADLTHVDGAQTHRSWWVARGSVVGAARGRGRALLSLKNGLEAPVSRTYAPALRSAGWF